jgi:hypothetical protein
VSVVVSDRRADLVSRQLARPLSVGTRLTLRVMAAVELVHAGASRTVSRRSTPWRATPGRTSTDVTRAAGLLRFAPTQTATFFDYDGDGRLDLFVGNESRPGDEHPCQLFHNGGDGTFSERAQEIGLGQATRVEWVEVRWPTTGEVQRVEGLRPGRHYRIREGTREATELKRPAFALSRTAANREKNEGGR